MRRSCRPANARRADQLILRLNSTRAANVLACCALIKRHHNRHDTPRKARGGRGGAPFARREAILRWLVRGMAAPAIAVGRGGRARFFRRRPESAKVFADLVMETEVARHEPRPDREAE